MNNVLENQLSNQEATSSQASSDENEYQDMGALLAGEDSGFRSLRRNQIVKGTVVSVDDETVLVHVGTKSEGVIPRDELAEEGEDVPELRYEQEVYVQVLEPDSPRGPILSLRRARREQSWEDMGELVQSGQTLTAKIIDHNRGGAITDVRGLRGFIPISQLVSLPPSAGPREEGTDDAAARLEQLLGSRVTVKVLQAERSQNRLILSERAAADEARALRRQDLLADLAPGQVRHGTVRNVTTFGAFVDLGGADGLVHVSELSYERVQDPRQVLHPGQEVDVYVLEVRPEDKRISLSIKRATADPWTTVSERYQPGQIVEATITRLMKFGAFAQVEPGVEGLIHISELAQTAPKDPGQVVHTGDLVQVKIIHIDPKGRRLGLSIRQVLPAEAGSGREMSAEEWHDEQARQSEPMPSAFHALSAIVDDLPDAEQSRIWSQSEADTERPDEPQAIEGAPEPIPSPPAHNGHDTAKGAIEIFESVTESQPKAESVAGTILDPTNDTDLINHEPEHPTAEEAEADVEEGQTAKSEALAIGSGADVDVERHDTGNDAEPPEAQRVVDITVPSEVENDNADKERAEIHHEDTSHAHDALPQSV